MNPPRGLCCGFMRRFLTIRLLANGAAVLGCLILAALAVGQSPTASEVVWQAAANFFGLVTTPFILEATVALLGLTAVMTYNQWRISKEGDGWVVLPEDEKKNAPPVEERNGPR